MRQPGKRRVSIPTFAFVVDGETEIWYLQMFKRNEQRDRNIRINIKPEIPHKKKLEDQFDLVCEQAKGEYDKVFWIVDLDVIIKETREAKTDNTPLKRFINFRATLLNEYDNVVVIVNNPCLEYWFLLHFDYNGVTYNNCIEVVGELRRYVKGYGKSERFYKMKGKDIYARLKPQLPNALNNSLKLGDFDDNNPEKGMCEMDSLFLSDELKRFFTVK